MPDVFLPSQYCVCVIPSQTYATAIFVWRFEKILTSNPFHSQTAFSLISKFPICVIFTVAFLTSSSVRFLSFQGKYFFKLQLLFEHPLGTTRATNFRSTQGRNAHWLPAGETLSELLFFFPRSESDLLLTD